MYMFGFFCVNNHYADDMTFFFKNSVGLWSVALDFRLFIKIGQRSVFFLKAQNKNDFIYKLQNARGPQNAGI